MKQRQGFTLVEMLVVLALVLFIMVILSEAFATGLETFRQLKAVGDMQEKLRSATTVLRHDLSNHRLERPNGTPRTLGFAGFGPPPFVPVPPPPPPPPPPSPYTPPTRGFFVIEQGGPLVPAPATGNYVQEGTDPDGLPSLRSVRSRLYFTIKVRVNNNISVNNNVPRREDYLSASVPPSGSNPADKLDTLGPVDYQATGVYNSLDAEVAYFLSKNPVGNTPAGTPLFTLYRRQLLLVDAPDNVPANTPPRPILSSLPYYHDASCRPGPPNPGDPQMQPTLQFNSISDVTNPSYRCLTCNPAFPPPWDSPNTIPYPILGDRGEPAYVIGDDVLLSDVVSFSVRILKAGKFDFESFVAPPPPPPVIVPPYGYDTNNIGTYDYRIAALEITIRIWDVKTQQTRQLTIIQNMGPKP